MSLTTLMAHQVDSCLYACLVGIHDDSNSIEAMTVTILVFLDAYQNMVARSYVICLMSDETMTTLPNML